MRENHYSEEEIVRSLIVMEEDFNRIHALYNEQRDHPEILVRTRSQYDFEGDTAELVRLRVAIPIPPYPQKA